MNLDELQALIWVRQQCASGRARDLRRASGLSLRNVAETAGVSEAAVYRWERKERVPTGAGALRYARVLQTVAAMTEPAA